MFKNVTIKRALKKTIFPIMTMLNKVMPKNDKIIFLYSANKGVQHNLIPLRDYLMERGYDKKYRIVCGIESMKYAETQYRVKYIGRVKSLIWFMCSGHVFYTTGQIPIKPSARQTVIHLDHGTTSIKTGNLLTKINNGDDFFFTYYTVPSEIYIPVVQKEFLCDKENIKINGEPVIDILYKETPPYTLGRYNKIGLWAPTFRQSDYLGYDDSTKEELLPMFMENDYKELNDVLHTYGVKLIVKLHPAQDLDGYSDLHLSNLDVFSDDDFKKSGFELYTLMKQMDFMLADYSSVYLEYMLLNRPIGFVIPDIDEYTEKRGFIFENVENYMPGNKIKTKEELYHFIKNISNNMDEFKNEREELCNIIHKYKDGNNCKRCLELSGITI